MPPLLDYLANLLSIKIWLVQMAGYHGIAVWFEWLDSTGRAAHFKVRPPERRSYLNLLPRVLANQFLLLLPSMVAFEALRLAYVGPASLSLASWLAGPVGLTVGHDVVQYAAHRFILHLPANMRALGHLVHHTTTGSRAISACYMSAADFFLEIVCPYLIPLALLGAGGASVIFHSLVVIAGAFGGLYEHSGYDFGRDLRAAEGLQAVLGKLLSAKAHAAHHLRGNVSFSDGFGSFDICDILFRTRFDLAAETRELADAALAAASGKIEELEDA